LSLGSHSGELVRDSSGVFHLVADDGTKIERLTGDLGDISVASQETCTTTSYAPAPSSNPMMLTYPSETIEVSGPCGTAPSTAKTLMDKRIFYDGDGSITSPGTYGKLGQSWPSDGATPQVHSLGNMTAVQTIKSYDSSGSPAFVLTGALTYDKYGRVSKSLDGAGQPTTTTYVPTTSTLPTSVVTTNPLGWVSTTTIDPSRGAVTQSKDANGRLTDSTFDALGRRTAVWLPGRAKADFPDTPDEKFSYSVHGSGASVAPSTVTTHTLREDETYDTSISLYDGMLQLRQTQTQSPASAGRLITSYYYDSHGWQVRTDNAYVDTANEPSTTLWAALETDVPSEATVFYDGLGRPVQNQTLARKVLVAQSTTTYPGVDEVDTTPPAGGKATATVTNALGQTTASTAKDTTPDRKLTAGTVIASGSSYASNSVRLSMQADGNLVLTGITSGTTLWSSDTAGNPGASATIRTDGSFVVTSTAGTVLWNSGSATTGSTGAYLLIRDDASVQVYSSAGASKWSSGTAGKATAANATTHYTYTPAGLPALRADGIITAVTEANVETAADLGYLGADGTFRTPVRRREGKNHNGHEKRGNCACGVCWTSSAAPGLTDWLLPQTAEQFHLLDAVGQLGVLLLVATTGMELDLARSSTPPRRGCGHGWPRWPAESS